MLKIGIRILATAVILPAAGCQHDVALRAVDSHGHYAPSYFDAHGFSIESDTRRVKVDFPKPPIDDSDTIFVYFSIPVHPIKGVQFSDISIGAGWSDAAVLVSGVFVPFTPPNPVNRAWPLPQPMLVLLPRVTATPTRPTQDNPDLPALNKRP